MQNKVLIIEDDALLAKSLSANLNYIGIETAVANNWEEGMRISTENPQIALILLDYLLPDKNGLEVLELLKETDNTKNIPVVFLTNVNDTGIMQEGLEKGASGYLIKSDITIDTIIDITSQYIEVPEIKIG